MINKKGSRYVKIDPWCIIEENFDKSNMRVLESLFTVSNGYIGTRGYFDELYTGDTHIGTYVAGVFEEIYEKPSYKGVPNRTQFVVNNANWLYTRIIADGDELDLNQSNFSEYKRVLDLKKGILTREFIWHTQKGSSFKLKFERFISMTQNNVCCQKIEITSLNKSGKVKIISGVDFSHKHRIYDTNYWECLFKTNENDYISIGCKTIRTNKISFANFKIETSKACEQGIVEDEKIIAKEMVFDIEENESIEIEKVVVINSFERLNESLQSENRKLCQSIFGQYSYSKLKQEHEKFWERMWEEVDIEIGQDSKNQQGIRFCIFQMLQAYSGIQQVVAGIGAKGLSGEVYNGNSFWDSEVYCLPFYLFTNIDAAKKLLEFRYYTLPQAKQRSKELDLKGAFYPIATIDGTESCTLWQHANLQLQVSTAVAYGLYHYYIVTKDEKFLFEKGTEILIEVCRMLESRCQLGQRDGKYGFFGVMGPDEFHMMVNNDFYTNYMAKKTFEFTIEVLKLLKAKDEKLYNEITKKTELENSEVERWANIAKNMNIIQDPQSKVFEQHEGYFNLPHIELSTIPEDQIPIYKNWAYDRIFRYDMIKQPAVLLCMLLFSCDFSFEEKKANYDYYDLRCIHESSLSPSIHSILACELGYYDKAYEYFKYATRLDLDNYNRNTEEGLHITSLAAAWLNIVYGFGGMRTDAAPIKLAPIIPDNWSYYSFRIKYNRAVLKIIVDPQYVTIKKLKGPDVELMVYDKTYTITEDEIKIPLQKRR